ncbi:hypothetical protein C1645_742394 [Glomus cerebriforme]|uniref:Uncharacterized protein n=1 Tax=Glomus cerebriforme TaxID=658196 RepID=A0A397SDK6_9GLOM|nr:hypothetical protein C1645_742394 [Glomus cerebriforme]
MSSSISSPITFINTNISDESIPSISESTFTSKHRVDKPVIIVTKTDVPAQETKEEVINAEFTLLTVISHPKRIINLPRAIKIYIASRKINYKQNELFTPDIKETQKNVYKNYDWYLYEALRADLICPPGKLLVVLLFWNIGSLAQYGICVILWGFQQQERPIEIYTVLSVLVLICEILPIPLVVNQYKKVIIAKTIAGEK